MGIIQKFSNFRVNEDITNSDMVENPNAIVAAHAERMGMAPRDDYDRSWDAIMPIVEKIVSEGHVFKLDINDGGCATFDVYDDEGRLDDTLEECGKETWCADVCGVVVMFIKWYEASMNSVVDGEEEDADGVDNSMDHDWDN